MQIEFLCLLATFAYVSILGWGLLSLWRLPSVNLLSLVLLGPVMGLAVLESTLMAGYLLLGPLTLWARVYALGLGVLAIAALIWRRRRDRGGIAPPLISLRYALLTLLFGAIAFSIVAWPALSNGIQYAVFRSTGSDSFVYASLADNFRLNALDELLEAGRQQNQLAVIDGHSGALLTARLFARYLPPGSFILQGFVSEIFGLVSHRVGHLLACLGLVTMGLSASALLLSVGVQRFLACGVGFFILANPFARFMLEMDATAQALAFGTLLAFIFFWAHGRTQSGIPYREAFYAALCAVAICITYHSLVPMLVLAVIIDLLLSRKKTVFFFHLTSGVFALILLVVSGQFGWVLSSFLSTLEGLNSGAIAGYPAITEFLEDFPKLTIAHVYGLFDPLPYFGPLADNLLKSIQFGVGGLLLILSGLAILVSFFRRERSGVIYVVSLCIVSLAFFIVSAFLKRSDFVLGKLLVTVQPLLCLTAFWMLYSLVESSRFLNPGAKRLLPNVIAIMVGLFPFTMLTTWLNVSSKRSSPLGYAKFKVSDYDFSPIHAFLKDKPGAVLSVDVPDKVDWRLSYAVNAEMQRYDPTYVSGYVYDNQENASLFPSARLPGKTQYLLTTDAHRVRNYPIGWNVVAQTSSTVLLERTSSPKQITDIPDDLETIDRGSKERPQFAMDALGLERFKQDREQVSEAVKMALSDQKVTFPQQLAALWNYSGGHDLSTNFFTTSPSGRKVGVVGWDSSLEIPAGESADIYTFGLFWCTFVTAWDESGKMLAMHYSGFNRVTDDGFWQQVDKLKGSFSESKLVTMLMAGAYAHRLAEYMKQVMPDSQIYLAEFPHQDRVSRAICVSTSSIPPKVYLEERLMGGDMENFLFGSGPDGAIKKEMFIPLSFFWPSANFPSRNLEFKEFQSEN
jgi:hypothetical protein